MRDRKPLEFVIGPETGMDFDIIVQRFSRLAKQRRDHMGMIVTFTPEINILIGKMLLDKSGKRRDDDGVVNIQTIRAVNTFDISQLYASLLQVLPVPDEELEQILFFHG